MNKTELIAYLRQSCIVQDPKQIPLDPVFLALTDAQIEAVLKVAMSSEAPTGNIENIDDSIVYLLILVAKKELYYQLATNTAPLYPLSLGKDGGLKKNIRFDHYMELIRTLEMQYKFYKETQTPIIAGEVKLGGRYYYTERNYNLAEKPSISLVADSVFDTYINLSWLLSKIDRFQSYILYQHTSQIVDLYSSTVINAEATKVEEIKDIHRTLYTKADLVANTEYHFAIAVQERNGLKGFSEITVTTLL